jgi:hypothetical protein
LYHHGGQSDNCGFYFENGKTSFKMRGEERVFVDVSDVGFNG